MNNAIRSFLIGSGIGAGAALLFAPQTGRRFRTRIRGKATRSMRALKESGQDMREQAAAAVAAGRRAYRTAVSAF